MRTQGICLLLLIALMSYIDESKLVESYSLENANLRKFGVSFGERPGHKKMNNFREHLRKEKLKSERIEREKEMKRMQIIHKYLMPFGGSTSFLKDFHSRF